MWTNKHRTVLLGAHVACLFARWPVRDAEVGSSNLPHPTKSPGQRRYIALRAGSLRPRFPTNSLLITARERVTSGSMSTPAVSVNAGDRSPGKRKPIYATVHAPNNKRARPRPVLGWRSSSLRSSWAGRFRRRDTRRVAQHITPHVGSIVIERLRPVDVQQLHAKLRGGGLSEGSIGRFHDILRAALGWAERLDLIVRNPAAKVDRPHGTKPDINPPDPAEVVHMITAASEPLADFRGNTDAPGVALDHRP